VFALAIVYLPHFEMPLDDVRDRIQMICIGGRRVCVMSPEDSLVHVCDMRPTLAAVRICGGRAMCSTFCCAHPQLDWPLVIETAKRSGLALPAVCTPALGPGGAGAPIPSERLTELTIAAGQSMR